MIRYRFCNNVFEVLTILCIQVLDDFASAVPMISQWVENNPAASAFQGLDSCLAKYQNPREADALTKVQAELDETRIILVSHLIKSRLLLILIFNYF